ncbi:MAG: hypothetical protein PHE61_01595 [Candidatus Omnitrophica bacterium]|nr:hypothetical protein [Candidatus Omnitrophota bacterium]
MKSSKIIVILILSSLLTLPIIMTVQAKETFTYSSKGKRDPFVPLIGDAYVLSNMEELELSELVLEGVIHDPQNVSYALINGKTLEVGHIVGGFKIVRIFEGGVVVEKEGNQNTLKIKTKENEPGDGRDSNKKGGKKSAS